MSAVASEVRAVSKRYDLAAIAFHWIVAALIVFLGELGLLFNDIPREARPFWIDVHGCVGLVYFVLVIARLAWRSAHRPPDLPADIGAFDRRMSAAGHHALYALMLLIPVFGVVAYVWHGRVFDYGLFQLNFGVHMNREVFEPAETIHQFLAYGLFMLAGLHVLAALYHHLVRRNGVLLRMLPHG
jgi:cytochrome b561